MNKLFTRSKNKLGDREIKNFFVTSYHTNPCRAKLSIHKYLVKKCFAKRIFKKLESMRLP